MFNKKIFLMLLLLAVAIVSITCVNAGDVNQTAENIAATQDINTIDVVADADEDNSKISSLNDNASDTLSASENNLDDVVGDITITNTTEPNATITITKSSIYAANNVIKFRITDLDGNPIPNVRISYNIYTQGYASHEAPDWDMGFTYSDLNGVITYEWDIIALPLGTYTVSANCLDEYGQGYVYAKEVKLENVKVISMPIKIRTYDLSTTYNSGKAFKVRVLDNAGKPLKGVGISLYISRHGGKYVTTLRLNTDKNGYVTYNKASKLPPGVYDVEIIVNNGWDEYLCDSMYISYITIYKKPSIVAAKSIYGKTYGAVHIFVYDKATKKPMNGVKVVVKIYTGKKYKKFTLVTGYDKKIYKSKGFAAIETNKFSIGKHKVVISVLHKYYKGSKVTFLKIPSSARNAKKYTGIVTNGKPKKI